MYLKITKYENIWKYENDHATCHIQMVIHQINTIYDQLMTNESSDL